MEKIEYRSVIKFLFKSGKSPLDIFEEMKKSYGEDSPSRATIYRWVNEFKKEISASKTMQGQVDPQVCALSKILTL